MTNVTSAKALLDTSYCPCLENPRGLGGITLTFDLPCSSSSVVDSCFEVLWTRMTEAVQKAKAERRLQVEECARRRLSPLVSPPPSSYPCPFFFLFSPYFLPFSLYASPLLYNPTGDTRCNLCVQTCRARSWHATERTQGKPSTAPT